MTALLTSAADLFHCILAARSNGSFVVSALKGQRRPVSVVEIYRGASREDNRFDLWILSSSNKQNKELSQAKQLAVRP
jgi:hypothetical protein